jgi:two-component system sensor histidine kinase/response regulator
MHYFLKDLAEAIPGKIIQIDEEGIIKEIIFNDEGLLYAQKENVIDKSIHEVMGPLSNMFFDLIQQTLSHNSPQSIEYEMPVLSGKTIFFEGRCVPMKHLIDGKRGVTLIARDITEKRQTQEALRLSEERFRNIYENAEACIAFADCNGNILSVNPAFEKLLEYSEHELKAKHFTEITHPEDSEKELVLVEQILKGAINKYQIEKRYITGTGKVLWVHLTLSGVYAENSHSPLYFIGVVTDISEQKLNEKLLRELNQTKDTFFSIIAHDLQSPLSGISGISEMMKNNFDSLDDANRKLLINSLYEGTQNLQTLLKNLLEWSRSQRGEVMYKPNSLNLKKVIDNTLNIVEWVSKQKDIHITNHIPESGSVYFDINILNTILRNLIGNALKYTPINGRIDIRLTKEGSDYVLSVEDSGIGMSKEYLEQLFHTENQMSVPGTSKEKGNGFGLILCKQLIDTYKGRIWVTSTINIGTTFYFTIPVLEG